MVAATPLTFDEEGVCSGCRVAAQKGRIDWGARFGMLRELAQRYKNPGGYDILIPVSGGKDSYYQAHVAVRELGLKPLLVTYDGNNFSPEGERNLRRMRDVFDCDHIVFGPGTDVLIRMNRIGFRLQGDMNWHNHCGIFTYPVQMAVKYRIPLVLWGEHGFMDLGGMHSYDDFVEFSAEHRLKYSLRGFDWYDFTDEGLERLEARGAKEGLSAADLQWAVYPSEEEISGGGGPRNLPEQFRGLGREPAREAGHGRVRLVPSKTPSSAPTVCSPISMTSTRMASTTTQSSSSWGTAGHDHRARMSGRDHDRDEAVEMVRRYDAVAEAGPRPVARLRGDVGGGVSTGCDTFRDPRVGASRTGTG